MRKIKIQSSSNKVVGGLVWSFGERIGAQLVSLLVSTVLARLIAPDNYGAISIVMVLISFLNVFVTSGFGSSLIQMENTTSVDFDTAFILSFSISTILYAVLFFCSPSIARYYEMNSLTGVIRVLGLRLPISAINNIQQVSIRRRMEFKSFFWATLVGTIVSGIIGILFALRGFGIWALVAQYLINVAIDTVALFFVDDWCPKMKFSCGSARKIFSFGWKVLATQLIASFEDNVRSLIIGKVFGSSDLAFYDQGKKYPSILVTNINSSIEKVMFPAYSRCQDNKTELLFMLRRSIRIGVYFLAPFLFGFAVVSKTFVTVVLTDKWIECVPYIQIFCLSYFTRPLESSCHQALLAVGEAGTVLKCITIINVFSVLGVLVSVFVIGRVLWIALFSLLTTLVSLLLFLLFSNIVLGYKIKMQVEDVVPSIIVALIMSILVYLIGMIQCNLLLLLVLQITSGVVIYILLSFLFKLEPFSYLFHYICSFLQDRKMKNGRND